MGVTSYSGYYGGFTIHPTPHREPKEHRPMNDKPKSKMKPLLSVLALCVLGLAALLLAGCGTTITAPTAIALDNAANHTAEDMRAEMDRDGKTPDALRDAYEARLTELTRLTGQIRAEASGE